MAAASNVSVPTDGLGPIPPPPSPGAAVAWWIARWRARFEVTPGRVSAVLVGVAVIGGVGWWLLRPTAPPIEASLPRASTPSPTSASGSKLSPPAAGAKGAGSPAAPVADGGSPAAPSSAVVVAAAGSIVRPGVYRLPAGARVDELIRRAGGLGADADGDRVNLAAPVVDGERIWIPRRGEEEPPQVVAGTGSVSGGGSGATAGGGRGSPSGAPSAPVDLNRATAEQLDSLPGVGPATAQAILAYRQEHGRFASVDDLLEVRGIGDAKLAQLRPLVSV